MNDRSDNPADGAVDENKLIAERRAKLARLREQGQAFPNDFRKTAQAGYLQTQFSEVSKESLEQANHEFAVAGRLIRNRGAFLLIQDGADCIQLYINRQGLDEETLEALKTWIWAISWRLEGPSIGVVRATFTSI